MNFVSTDEFSECLTYFPADVFEIYLRGEMSSSELMQSAKDPQSFSNFSSSSTQVNLVFNLSISNKNTCLANKTRLTDTDIECLAWELSLRAAGLSARSDDAVFSKRLDKKLQDFNRYIDTYFANAPYFEFARKNIVNQILSKYFALTSESFELESQYFLFPTGAAREEAIEKINNNKVVHMVIALPISALFIGSIWWFANELEPTYHQNESWNSAGNQEYLNKSISRSKAVDLNSNIFRYSDVKCSPTQLEREWVCQAKGANGAVSLAVRVGEKGDWRLNEF